MFEKCKEWLKESKRKKAEYWKKVEAEERKKREEEREKLPVYGDEVAAHINGKLFGVGIVVGVSSKKSDSITYDYEGIWKVGEYKRESHLWYEYDVEFPGGHTSTFSESAVKKTNVSHDKH